MELYIKAVGKMFTETYNSNIYVDTIKNGSKNIGEVTFGTCGDNDRWILTDV